MDLMVIWITKELLELYEYITTEELAERIGISDSSVRHRMVAVKEGFKRQGIIVTSSPQKGVKIEASIAQRDNMYNYIQQMAYSTSESKEYRKKYILDTLFEYSDNYTIQLFAADLFVSKKIVSRDLREVSEMLSPYHVKLVIKRNSGVLMEGNEFHVRQAMIAHYNSLWWDKVFVKKPDAVDPRISQRAWTYMRRIYSDVDIIAIQNALLLAEEELGVMWTDVAFARLLEYIVVSVRRIRRNRVICRVHAKELLPLQKEYCDVAEKLLKKLAGRVCTKQEVQYLAARIYISETVEPHMNREGIQYKSDVELYLKNVGCAVMGHDISKEDSLVTGICDLLMGVQYRENYNIVYWNDLNKEIKKTASDLYAVCLVYIDILKENSRLKFSEDDVAKITLLINNYIQNHRCEVVFVTATDEASSAYQMEKLQNAFPNLKFTDVVHYSRFNKSLFGDKRIVSTVRLPVNDDEYDLITKHVSREDVSRLEGAWKRRKSKSLISYRELMEERLMWEMNPRDKEDAIHQACIYLQDIGYVKGMFEEAVLKRDKELVSSIGNGMAIPHYFKENIEKEFIAVIKLKHRILWSKEDSVDILFVIALKPEHISMIATFFLDICAAYNSDNGNGNQQKELQDFKVLCRKNDKSH